MMTGEEIRRAFSGPNLLIAEADEAFDEFQRLYAEHLKRPSDVASMYHTVDETSGDKFYHIKFEPLPEIFQRKAYRVITDTRHSLDQAVNAATYIITGNRPTRNCYFPIVEFSEEFDALFRNKGRSSNISKSLIPCLREAKPWRCSKGSPEKIGNEYLAALNAVSGANKHQFIIAQQMRIAESRYKGISGNKVEFFIPPKRVSHDDVIVYRIPNGSDTQIENMELRVDPVFPEISEEIHAASVMAGFIGSAKGVVKKLIAAVSS